VAVYEEENPEDEPGHQLAETQGAEVVEEEIIENDNSVLLLDDYRCVT
jgi:hypothetical protein